MNVGLFGGTFDPIHRGHLAVARAAQQQFGLKQVLFIPASVPPHKRAQGITAYSHRYAMVALAVAEEKSFIPSNIESGEDGDAGPSYTIETLRRLRQHMKRADRLFFIIGIDAFLDIAKWREPEAVMRAAELIVVSRPGFSLADVGAALPESIRPKEAVTKAFAKHPATGDLALGDITLHLLADVAEKISATQIRQAARTGRKLDSLVGPAVADYIRKTGLYKAKPASAAPSESGKVVQMQAGPKQRKG